VFRGCHTVSEFGLSIGSELAGLHTHKSLFHNYLAAALERSKASCSAD